MEKSSACKRFLELRAEENSHLNVLYDLEVEEKDIVHADHWEHIKAAKRKAGKAYDNWWKENKEEYERLRKELCP